MLRCRRTPTLAVTRSYEPPSRSRTAVSEEAGGIQLPTRRHRSSRESGRRRSRNKDFDEGTKPGGGAIRVEGDDRRLPGGARAHGIDYGRPTMTVREFAHPMLTRGRVARLAC